MGYGKSETVELMNLIESIKKHEGFRGKVYK